MNEEMLNEHLKKLTENEEKIGLELLEFESKVRFFGELINEDEMEKIFESEVESIYYAYGMNCRWNVFSTYIEEIIEDVPEDGIFWEPEDWDDRDTVISDICHRWHKFLKEFARQNFPPELDKVLEILKQIGYDDERKIEDFFYGACDETGIDEYTLNDLFNALYKAKMLNMEIVDFILSVSKQLVEKKHLTYCEG